MGQFTNLISCINPTVLLFSSICHHHLADASLPQKFFTLAHLILRIFLEFSPSQHFILYIAQGQWLRTIASSSCRNFSTRSLNRKNSKRTYWNWWVLIIHAQGRFLWKPRKLQPPEAKVTHHCLVEILYFSQREGGVNDLTHRPSKQMYRASLYTPTYKAPTKNLIFSGSN